MEVKHLLSSNQKLSVKNDKQCNKTVYKSNKTTKI